jgi:hypothetical protein
LILTFFQDHRNRERASMTDPIAKRATHDMNSIEIKAFLSPETVDLSKRLVVELAALFQGSRRVSPRTAIQRNLH